MSLLRFPSQVRSAMPGPTSSFKSWRHRDACAGSSGPPGVADRGSWPGQNSEIDGLLFKDNDRLSSGASGNHLSVDPPSRRYQVPNGADGIRPRMSQGIFPPGTTEPGEPKPSLICCSGCGDQASNVQCGHCHFPRRRSHAACHPHGDLHRSGPGLYKQEPAGLGQR